MALWLITLATLVVIIGLSFLLALTDFGLSLMKAEPTLLSLAFRLVLVAIIGLPLVMAVGRSLDAYSFKKCTGFPPPLSHSQKHRDLWMVKYGEDFRRMIVRCCKAYDEKALELTFAIAKAEKNPGDAVLLKKIPKLREEIAYIIFRDVYPPLLEASAFGLNFGKLSDYTDSNQTC